MLRTAVLSLLLALCGYAAADWLTHGFQVWTDEGARRLEVALQPVDAPRVAVDGPGVAAPDLPALFAQAWQRQPEAQALQLRKARLRFLNFDLQALAELIGAV